MVIYLKDFLCKVYKEELHSGHAELDKLSDSLRANKEEMENFVEELEKKGIVRVNGKKLNLTDKGRKKIKVVFMGGTFEILHYGHIYTIKKAKELGDFLVVVVARDSTVRKMKGREPIVNEQKREELVSSIRYVDSVVRGSEVNIYETLEKVKPDIVALGYDQHHSEKEIIQEAKKRGLTLDVVRLDSPIPELKTSKLIYES